MTEKETITLKYDDWITILSILEIRKETIENKEDACEIQRIITEIKQQIKS